MLCVMLSSISIHWTGDLVNDRNIKLPPSALIQFVSGQPGPTARIIDDAVLSMTKIASTDLSHPLGHEYIDQNPPFKLTKSIG